MRLLGRVRRMGQDAPGGIGGMPPTVVGGLRPGSQVAGYRLEEQIGRGGMAVVYRARDERLGRSVALKVLDPERAGDAGFRQRFLRESRVAAAVDDPHVIPVFEAGEAGGYLFLAMRLVRGGDVESLLAAEGPLEPGRACGMVTAVASALDAAHADGLVHRDVKPANMLLDARPGRPDHVYLSDFGISRQLLATSRLTRTDQFLGTLPYAAPEQFSGVEVGGRADQYALACVAFELLSGSPPFVRDSFEQYMYAHLSTPPPKLTERRQGLPPTADEVFAKALAKSPADRFGSCGEFAGALRSALDTAGSPPAPPPGPRRRRGTDTIPQTKLLPAAIGRSRRWLIAFAVLAAAIAAAIVILTLTLLGGPTRSPTALSAVKAVAAVPPDRLAEALLGSKFAHNEVPRGASEFSTHLTDFRAAGLEASTYTSFLDPAASIEVHYYVYDNQSDARSAFVIEDPIPKGYKATGSFTATGIADPSKCATGPAATSSGKWAVACLTLSNRVLSFALVHTNGHVSAAAKRLTTTLARDAIRHLQDVARKTPKAALPPPPGQLTPGALFSRLGQSSFNPAWLTATLSSPTVQTYRIATIPAGLLSSSYIQVTFQGPDHGDLIHFFVFGSPQEAQSWFNQNLEPTGSTKTGTIVSPGFSQRSYCGTYSRGASQQFPTATGFSVCYVLWGNVVLDGETQSIMNKHAANNNMAVTLARMGVIYLDQI
jgi:serine/threonine protein kinase